MFGFDGKCSAGHPKAKFRLFSLIARVSALKHFIEKPILLNFVNLSTALCPRS